MKIFHNLNCKTNHFHSEKLCSSNKMSSNMVLKQNITSHFGRSVKILCRENEQTDEFIF